MTEYILSFDLGTTAIKTALFDTNGKLIAKSTQEYELKTPTPVVVEQEVAVYWKAIKDGIRVIMERSRVLPRQITCIGISAQGETLVPVDNDGSALRPAIVWMDNRAQEEAEEIGRTFSKQELCERTGQVEMVPTWPAAKILWLKRHEPHTFNKTAKFLLIEDWLIHRLTRKFVAEGSLLCSTCYWDIRSKIWWTAMLQFLGICEEQLPEVVEPGTLVGRICEEAALELGLATETLIVTGGLDQACGAIGAGNIKPGIVSENTGAALAMCAIVDGPFCDPTYTIPCFYYALPDTYMAHSFTTGGMVLRWFRDNFCQEERSVASRTGEDTYDLLALAAESIPPGSEGLVLLPHLQGAGAPESNGKAKGVLYGFTLHHTKAHVIRAIMESLGLAIRRIVDGFEDLGIAVSEIRSLGGGAKSKLWTQIKADITGRPIVVTRNPEDAACLGAAILAGVATGIWINVEQAVEEAVSLGHEPTCPRQENRQTYAELYEAYKHLYDDICELYNIYNPC